MRAKFSDLVWILKFKIPHKYKEEEEEEEHQNQIFGSQRLVEIYAFWICAIFANNKTAPAVKKTYEISSCQAKGNYGKKELESDSIESYKSSFN